MRIDPETLQFDLPPVLIAQQALEKRDDARLLVLDRRTGAIDHRRFFDLADYFRAGDVLVINKAKVNKARISAKKKTGGRVDILLTEATANPAVWKALLQPFLPIGTPVVLPNGRIATVLDRTADGEFVIDLNEMPGEELMTAAGAIPLPPYIKRDSSVELERDARLYQTVYAEKSGSVAAPTAGLHFTEAVFQALKKKGVSILSIVLHVGWGTFRPIRETVATHRMLSERFEIDRATWDHLLEAKKNNRRIIAVGTTVTRTLESLPGLDASAISPRGVKGETNIFIRPGHVFSWVKGLVTNFHVPRSTPLSLVSAFAGLEKIEAAYEAAINEQYRFFSYGDAMLIMDNV